MAAWIHYKSTATTYDEDAWYNILVEGQAFDPSGAGRLPYTAPATGKNTGDPYVAFSATTGVGFATCINARALGTIWVCTKQPGQLMTAQQVRPNDDEGNPVNGVDKPVVAVGPDATTGIDVLDLVWALPFAESSPCDPNTQSQHRLWRYSSADSGMTWPDLGFPVGPDFTQTHKGNHGGPGQHVFIRSSPNVGRRVTAYRPEAEVAGPECAAPLPRATWSNNGTLWLNSTNPTLAWNPDTHSAQAIAGVPPSLSPPVDLPIEATNEPSLGVDPRPGNGNHLYMLFSATIPNSGNVDLFIAHSADGGANFSGTSQPGLQVLHLRDQDLGEVLTSAQIMGALVVDQFGGVNFIYYTAETQWTDPANPVWRYRVNYGRIASFGTDPVPSIVHFPLTNWFDLEGVTGLYRPDSVLTFLGDYVTGDTRGCDVYFAFPARDGVGGINIFVSKVRVSTTCTIAADIDQNGDINLADATLFLQCYCAGDPRADITQNGVIDGYDVVQFDQSFVCGCNP